MRKMTVSLVFGIVLLALTAGPAAAVIVPGDLTLYIEVDGKAYIQNNSGSPVAFDTYEIWSGGGNLDPSEYYPEPSTSGWRSFEDWLGNDFTPAYAALGNFTWGEITTPTTSLVAELNLSNATTLADGGSLFIGYPAPSAVPSDSHVAGTSYTGDIEFYYHAEGGGGDKCDGHIAVIPEPATMVLLGLGLVAIVSKRKRN